MEKLKVLLNKFLKTKPYKREFKSNEEIDKYGVLIISKQFEFIAWLVKNNMIDLDMVREKLGIPCCVWYGSGRIIAVNDVEDYGQILMLLAIQEDPIKFLATILK